MLQLLQCCSSRKAFPKSKNTAIFIYIIIYINIDINLDFRITYFGTAALQQPQQRCVVAEKKEKNLRNIREPQWECCTFALVIRGLQVRVWAAAQQRPSKLASAFALHHTCQRQYERRSRDIRQHPPTIGQIGVRHPRGRSGRTRRLDGANYRITPTSGIAEAEF